MEKSELKVNVQDYGESSPELYTRLDLAMSSLRIAHYLPTEDLKKCYMILPKSGMTVNGNVYKLPNLATRIGEKEFLLLPTPAKSDAYIILKSSCQLKKYYQNGHQDKTLYQCQLNGLTPSQTMNVYEWMMGFPLDWTLEE